MFESCEDILLRWVDSGLEPVRRRVRDTVWNDGAEDTSGLVWDNTGISTDADL